MITCLNCNKEINKKQKFCGSSCSAKYNNRKRVLSQETKIKISKALTIKLDTNKLIKDFSDGMTIKDLSISYGVSVSTIKKCLSENETKRIFKNENSFCLIHKTEKIDKNGKFLCIKCNTDVKQTRRQKLKKDSVDYLGGKCNNCGYKNSLCALDFHHLDPSEKEFNLGGMGSKSWEIIKKELDKCILLCANCHREEHERLRK